MLVLAPAEQAALLTSLVGAGGYEPLVVTTVTEAMNLAAAAAPAALLAWVQPDDADSLASLRTLASRGGMPVLAVVGGEWAALRGTLAQLGARGTVLLVADADSESLDPLRQVLEADARERKRRRLGHAIP